MADICFSLQAPTQHPCYAGHFPNAPVVPGAVLLYWFESTLTAQCGLSLKSIKQVKFMSAVTPGDTLKCTISTEAARIRFKAYKEGVLSFSGSATAAQVGSQHP